MAEKNVHETDLSDTMPALNVPESIAENMDLFLRLVRKVLDEFDPGLLETFDVLLSDAFRANADEAAETDDERAAFAELERTIDGLDERRATLLMRAFVAYFHLANICEEHYRVTSLRERESSVDPSAGADPINDLTVAYRRLVDECGRGKATALLQRLEFRPVFTAHPTEARRKAVEGKIRRISGLLEEHAQLGGAALAENERRLLQEIDALLRTSPIAHKKPTPVEEADTIIDIFDNTLFDMVPDVYRRFDDWELGERAGTVPPVCPAFFHPGSWIGSDRDGNPNVTARVSRQVAEKKAKATVFGYRVSDPERYGVAEFDKDGNCLSIEEKPEHPKSNYAVVGLYFYPNKVVNVAKSIKPSARGELEITTVNQEFLKDHELKVQTMARGFAWLDTGTHDSLSEASTFIEVLEKRQGLKVACLEGIAYRQGWITADKLRELAKPMLKNDYGKYLLSILEEKEDDVKKNLEY